MALDEIVALPVRELAADDRWLFLWAPACFLPQALELMEAWGFKYSSSAFRWLKQNKSKPTFWTSLGHTTRKSVEDCWLGRRGSPRRNASDVGELIVAPRREHSRKPDERIQRFCSGPYLELFARARHPGFDARGDEVNHFQEVSHAHH
jgi:N6-adenosine-specific RNA methylase IME4